MSTSDPADAVPAPVKGALVATLVVTAAAVVAYALSNPAGRVTGLYLFLFSLLFVARVVGQVVVAIARPSWLPPMRHWNYLTYKILLPIQLAFVAVMAWVVHGFLTDGAAASPRPALGTWLLAASFVYGAVMVVRYALRMRLRPDQRWFGGTIPIVFHLVLAAFLFVLGSHLREG